MANGATITASLPMPLDLPLAAYLVAYCAALVVAGVLSLIRQHDIEILAASYWRFLLRPWKVATFVVATAGLVVVGPFTGDPYWDTITAVLMSVLTFAFAPWAVGTLWKLARRERGGAAAYVAVCLWMLGASWSYDLYLLLRDGLYPSTWAWNLAASSFLFGAAGVYWNLDWDETQGIHFAFVGAGWPAASRGPVFLRLLPVAGPIMLFVAVLIGVCLVP